MRVPAGCFPARGPRTALRAVGVPVHPAPRAFQERVPPAPGVSAGLPFPSLEAIGVLHLPAPGLPKYLVPQSREPPLVPLQPGGPRGPRPPVPKRPVSGGRK